MENEQLLKKREEEALNEKREQEMREKQRIKTELKRRKTEAREFAAMLDDRIGSFPEPLHFACCQTLSKVSLFLPFPMECTSKSSSLPCFDLERSMTVQENVDASLAEYLTEILVDTTEECRDIELKHRDEEHNDIEVELVTPLIESIISFNSSAFLVDLADFPLNDSELDSEFDHDIQEVKENVF